MAIGMPHDGGGAADPGEIDGGAIFAEINITPLTDVILVLLIIVMLFATKRIDEVEKREKQRTAQASSGLKVNLPDGAAKEIEAGSKSLVVGILANGEIYVNGQRVAETDLDTIFQKNYRDNKDTQVVIQADGKAQHERVVNVMERAKNSGLKRIAIATRAAGGG